MTNELKIVAAVGVMLLLALWPLYAALSWVRVDEEHQETLRSCLHRYAPAECVTLGKLVLP